VTYEEEPEEPPRDSRQRMARMVIGWIVGAVIIFLAQRDLRRRPDAMVRGPKVLWRVIGAVPPGAVAYFIVGRRRSIPIVLAESTEKIAV